MLYNANAMQANVYAKNGEGGKQDNTVRKWERRKQKRFLAAVTIKMV